MNAPGFAPPAAGAHTLETLPFDNRYARLPANFYTRLSPEPLPAPYLVGVSDEVAALLGLHPAELARPEFVGAFAGNLHLPGAEPLAAVYSGHQFGEWAGQLGDGRAHLLGQLAASGGHWELQLKGAGQTPYSRFADGRAVLRSSIREFLCSEAMAGLGVPTTRALCVVGSDAPVQRETLESAAVVTRVAPCFVRFGSFEHWAARKQPELLRQLADHVIDHYLPALREAANPYEALLREACRSTARMVAHWQAVGFMHGVMNTDNMSILGLTLDYGPFGFMEAFDAGHICNHSDHHGRYAYRAQPRVAHWNLYALGNALYPLIGDEERVRAAIEESYPPCYNAEFLARLRTKLGLAHSLADDEDFIAGAYGLLQRERPDHTLFFRGLSALPGRADPDPELRRRHDAPVLDHFIDRAAAEDWLALWRLRLAQEGARADAERQAQMRAANPRFVLRNWMAEAAIRKARERDYGEVARILRCLRRPYDEQPEFDDYATLPPDWARGLSVSCSS